MLEIILEVVNKKDKYSYQGEKANFVVQIESPELINAIDLNVIKNVLAQKALQLQAEKDAIESMNEKDEGN